MIIAANWKMNPDLASAALLVSSYTSHKIPGGPAGPDGSAALLRRILFAPHPYLVPMGVRLEGSGIDLGGQDCHAQLSGAHTGDVSAQMLLDCGVSVVLLGHSERRTNHGESDADVCAKAKMALAAGLEVMVCVGESNEQREQGRAIEVVTAQLAASLPDDITAAQVSIAYEPVWAIGTGKVASIAEISEMHEAIRAWLAGRNLDTAPILYGGSVKPDNAGNIFAIADVDGALVGGASLDGAQFGAICDAAAISQN